MDLFTLGNFFIKYLNTVITETSFPSPCCHTLLCSGAHTTSAFHICFPAPVHPHGPLSQQCVPLLPSLRCKHTSGLQHSHQGSRLRWSWLPRGVPPLPCYPCPGTPVLVPLPCYPRGSLAHASSAGPSLTAVLPRGNAASPA